MARWIATKDWTSTEIIEVMDLVMVNKKMGQKGINQDAVWLKNVIKRNPSIAYVVVVKEKPKDAKRAAVRYTCQVYLVNRKGRGGQKGQMVRMLYLVPR